MEAFLGISKGMIMYEFDHFFFRPSFPMEALGVSQNIDQAQKCISVYLAPPAFTQKSIYVFRTFFWIEPGR
jgi:hypothetical protein